MVLPRTTILAYRIFMWCLVAVALYVLFVFFELAFALIPLDKALVAVCVNPIAPESVSSGIFGIALNPLNWGARLANVVNATYGNATKHFYCQPSLKNVSIKVGTTTIPT